MVYIEGRGFQMGLQLGQLREQAKRQQQYDEDRLRAISEHLEDRARALSKAERELQEHQVDRARAFNDRQTELGQERAQGEMNRLELGQTEQDALAQNPDTLAPGQAGPPSPNESAIRDYFARVGDVAKRMRPENRPQYLMDARDRLKEQKLAGARQEVAQGIQDRLAHGAFNFLDEAEPNEAIMQRVEFLLKGLDSKDVNPVAASEMEGQILESIRKENQRRLELKRGTETIDEEITRAKTAGNLDVAHDMETIRAMWGTGELKPDDLVDRIFEAKNGRKTARAEAQVGPKPPTPFQVRTAAVKLWQGAHPEATELPKEEEIRAIERLLVPQPVMARQVTAGPVQAVPSGTDEEEAAGVPEEADPAGPESAPAGAPSSPKSSIAPLSMGTVGPSQADRSKPKAPKGAKGAQARPWAKLKPKEQKDAEKRLMAVVKASDTPDALRAALAELGIDPASVPPEVRARLASAKKGPSLGEAVSHLHPGAGGM